MPETPDAISSDSANVAADSANAAAASPASAAASASYAANDAAAQIISWTVHPLVEWPRRSLGLALLFAAILGIVYFTLPGPLYLIVSVGVLFGSMGRFFLPTRYTLSAEGICVRFAGVARRFPWTNFRRVEAGPHGVFLSPFERPNRLENFRGLYLLLGARREEAVAYIRERLHVR